MTVSASSRADQPLSRRATSGMTLLEVVVGLMITGVAMTAGYGALASVLDQRDRAEEVLTQTLEAANIRRELRQWLAGARLTIEEDGPGMRGLDGVADRRTDGPADGRIGGRADGRVSDDMLTILTTAPTPVWSTRRASCTGSCSTASGGFGRTGTPRAPSSRSRCRPGPTATRS